VPSGRASNHDAQVQASEFYTDLGGFYYLQDSDIAPFVGGGVGLHAINATWQTGFFDPASGLPITKSESQTATALWVGGGVTVLRSANVHVMGVAKYTVDMVNLDGKPASGVMLGVSVTYHKHTACWPW
jgi:hypothetical protein